MKKILVGIDGTRRGDKALEWALKEADVDDSEITLLHVVDPRQIGSTAAGSDVFQGQIDAMLQSKRDMAEEKRPGVSINAKIMTGGVVEILASTSKDYDAVVLGSHHGRSVSETFTGAKPLRIAITSAVPTVVVPVDWDPNGGDKNALVGVAPDDSSDSAIELAIKVTNRRQEHLELMSVWGIPSFLSKPAEAMGGGLGPVGEEFQRRLDGLVAYAKQQCPNLDVSGKTVEGPTISKVLIEKSADYRILYLGTHQRSAIGRAMFGSVTHSVLMNLVVPTIVVPQP